MRSPYSVRLWTEYLKSHELFGSGASAASAAEGIAHFARVRCPLYERALKLLPGSYKLWKGFTSEAVTWSRRCLLGSDDPFVKWTNGTFERALTYMGKMPEFWLDYVAFLEYQKVVTCTRRAYDRALRALPVTQHKRIWDSYIVFVKSVASLRCPCTCTRGICSLTDRREDFVDHLTQIRQPSELARQLSMIVNDDKFVSISGKTRREYALQLCATVAKSADVMPPEINADAAVRKAIEAYPEDAGSLWCSLADCHIRLGDFSPRAYHLRRGMNAVKTILDFSLVFDAYVEFEDAVTSAMMNAEKDEDADAGLKRIEKLMDRREVLLNNVKLRQNSNIVATWMERIEIFKSNPVRMINTYADAVKTIDPAKAIGSISSLWIDFARLYEDNGDFPNARVVFEKGTQASFHRIEDLVNVWCAFAEMEVRRKEYASALQIVRRCRQGT